MTDRTVRRITTDHDEIRGWAEERGGTPALIREAAGALDPGEPRIKFSERERTLQDVDWEAFFRALDQRKLAMLYIGNPDGEDEDTFFRFVDRDVDFDDTLRPLEKDAPLTV